MTKKKRVVRASQLKGCPLCGGQWRKVSGFMRCEKCGHVNRLFTPQGYHDAYPDLRPRNEVIGQILTTNKDDK